MKKEDCIFCKIANGDIPTDMVYENDLVAAFADASPMMPVHVLVVPKGHYDNIADDVPSDVAGALLEAVGKVADIKGISESGFRVIANTNDDACQSVHHLHLHVLGGEKMNDGNPRIS